MIDVYTLKNPTNPRISNLTVNGKNYEIWDGTAREAINEIQTTFDRLDDLTSYANKTGDGLTDLVRRVSTIYNELVSLGDDNDGLADSVIDSLFNKFEGDQAKVAKKIGTSTVGSTKQPVYINNGVPTAIGYTIAKSVPADAVFTDTKYTLAGLMGSTAKGSSAQPIYWNGSAFATTAYTLGVSVPSNAVFTDTTYNVANQTTLGLIKPWYYHSKASTGPTASSNATAVAVNAISTTSGRYYAVEMDVNGRAFVNVPWTSATLTGLAGSTAIGSATQPIYWNGSSFATTSYTLGKSVPSNAVFTDTTYSTATTTTAGLIKAAGARTSAVTTTQGGTTSGRYYGVEVDSAGKAFVNVPWVNNTYTVNNATFTITGQSGNATFTANASANVSKTVSIYEKTAPSASNNYTLEIGIKFA